MSYRAAITLLQLLDMIEQTEAKPVIKPMVVDMYAVVTKDFADFNYAGNATNFQSIKNGDALPIRTGGH